jgi:uncharacterized protein YhaN
MDIRPEMTIAELVEWIVAAQDDQDNLREELDEVEKQIKLLEAKRSKLERKAKKSLMYQPEWLAEINKLMNDKIMERELNNG